MPIPMLERLSFTRQFVVFSFVILVVGMITIGIWVSSAIEQAVVNRTAGVTALYVDSFVSPLVQDLSEQGELSPTQRADLGVLLTDTPLGEQIVSFKIWSPEGEIIYSPNPELVGRTFAMGGHLLDAFKGEVASEISDLTEQENEYERSNWETLIETYAPVRSEGSGAVFAVSEFYQLPDTLVGEIRRAQIRGWLIVGVATLVMYLLLIGMVRRASTTIRTQRSALLEHVDELREALDDNRGLQARLKKAAARTTTLNERFLRRVSADIHDGPAQDVSLALLRVEGIAEGFDGNGRGSREDVERLRGALDSALTELRAISQGLRAPSVEDLTPGEAAKRAVTDYERLWGESISFDDEAESSASSPSVNITVYRVVQESLANSFKHARSASRRVEVKGTGSQVEILISDTGPGFELAEVSGGDTLGLVGMRERVELLGGEFTVETRRGEGTVVRATLPLAPEAFGV